MKPSFALNLTSDSIGLLQRTEGGWQDIGSVPFDSPDLPAALGTLRGKAGPGLTSKIVLPDSQILYTEVVAPGPDTGARRTQIRAALEGLTPYAVRELVFDWHGSGDRVKVAVIARETLQEAEAFAEEHGFNPLSFVAAPSADKFGKEPWFGTTAGAQKRLPKGEKVERDLEALVLAGAAPEEEAALPEAAEPLAHPVPEVVEPEIPGAELPEAEAEELPPSEAEAAPESAEPLAHPLPEVVEPEIPGSELPEEPELEAEAPETVEPAEDAPEAVEPVSSEPEAPQPEAPEPEVIAERFTDVVLPAEAEPVAAEEMPEPEPAPEDEAEDAPLPATPEFVPPPFRRAPERPIPHARDLPPFAPPVTPPVFPAGPAKPAARPQVGVADSEIPEAPFVEVAEEPAAGAPATFASRRGLEGAAAPLGPVPGFGAKARAGKAGETDRIPPRPVGMKTAGAAPAPAAQRAAGLSVTAPSLPGARGRKPAAKPAPQPAIPPRPAAATSAPASPSSIDSLGSFTGRQLPKRGKPRHLGLILTGVLLLVLAAIAAWASFTDFSGETTAPTEISDAAGAAESGVEDEMLADLQDPAEIAPEADAVPAGAEAALPAPDADAAAAPQAEAVAEPAPVQAEAAPIDAPAPAAEAPEVAETAVTPPAAAGDAAQDEIFLTAMDAPQPTLDAAALPDPPVAPDAAPGAQMPPPPFGTVYDFDAEGLIVPTAEGIVAPGGFTLVAGAPAVKPPSRPASAAPAETATEAAAPAAATSGALGSLVPTAPAANATETVADPALAGARPRVRPAELTTPAATPEQETALPEAAAEAIEEAVAEAATDATSPRPRARPAGAVEAAPAAQDATLMMASAPAPRPDTPEVAAAADGSISPLAIAVSRKPVARPSNFSGAIEAAVAAAVQQPAAAPAAAAIARVEPEEQDEPEVQPVVAPRIPTRANVAQQATFANAINLREMNLIGVYGTSSNRYALVRQSNGKYRRVSVGDRLDGGTVAAITASELRYRKGSRMLALQMPRG